jgi:hypothetical protein
MKTIILFFPLVILSLFLTGCTLIDEIMDDNTNSSFSPEATSSCQLIQKPELLLPELRTMHQNPHQKQLILLMTLHKLRAVPKQLPLNFRIVNNCRSGCRDGGIEQSTKTCSINCK